MTEFHFEDPDLKSSKLEIGLPSCAVPKDNFTDSKGKRVRMENKESFQIDVRKQREHLRCRSSHRPGCLRSLLLVYGAGTGQKLHKMTSSTNLR